MIWLRKCRVCVQCLMSIRGRSVPWFDWAEWEEVFLGLCSAHPESKRSALRGVDVWRSRGKLPIAVDCTAALVEAMMMDSSFQKGSEDPTVPRVSACVLRHHYSMVVVRLVNGVVDRAQVKGGRPLPIDYLAHKMGFPSSLVELRHEATHGRLPTLPALRLAAQQILQYLMRSYWIRQKEEVKRGVEAESEGGWAALEKLWGRTKSVKKIERALKTTKVDDGSVEWLLKESKGSFTPQSREVFLYLTRQLLPRFSESQQSTLAKRFPIWMKEQLRGGELGAEGLVMKEVLDVYEGQTGMLSSFLPEGGEASSEELDWEQVDRFLEVQDSNLGHGFTWPGLWEDMQQEEQSVLQKVRAVLEAKKQGQQPTLEEDLEDTEQMEEDEGDEETASPEEVSSLPPTPPPPHTEETHADLVFKNEKAAKRKRLALWHEELVQAAKKF